MSENCLASKQARIQWVDFCRGIAIILMVIGHAGTMPEITKIIYSFHMPLFVMITGFFYKTNYENMPVTCYAKRISRKYIFPLGVFIILNILIEISANLLFNSALEPQMYRKWLLGALTGIDKYGWMSDWPQLWYLYAVYLVSLIFFLIRKYTVSFITELLFILFPLIGYLCYLFKVPKLIWNFDSASVLLMFFYIGYLVNKNFKSLSRSIIKYKNFALMLFIISFGIAYTNPTPAGLVGFDYNTYGDFAMMIVPAIIISVGTMLLSYVIYEKQINNVKGLSVVCDIISWFGKNTLVVFGFDLMINRVAINIASFCEANKLLVIVIKLLIDCALIFVWSFCRKKSCSR